MSKPGNKTTAVLPVKLLNQTKRRLLPVLSEQECALLGRNMALDVLDALIAATAPDNVIILSDDLEIAHLGTEAGCEIVSDHSGGGLTPSLDAIAAILQHRGVETMLIVPADMLTLKSADIDALLTQHDTAVSICPAGKDGGTNALVCSPPAALALQFGTDSAKRHAEQALESGLKARLIELEAFRNDVDTPDDLRWLLSQHISGHTAAYINESGIRDRPELHTIRASA